MGHISFGPFTTDSAPYYQVCFLQARVQAYHWMANGPSYSLLGRMSRIGRSPTSQMHPGTTVYKEFVILSRVYTNINKSNVGPLTKYTYISHILQRILCRYPLAQQADLPRWAKLEYAAPRRGTSTRQGRSTGGGDMHPRKNVEICVSEMAFFAF